MCGCVLPGCEFPFQPYQEALEHVERLSASLRFHLNLGCFQSTITSIKKNKKSEGFFFIIVELLLLSFLCFYWKGLDIIPWRDNWLNMDKVYFNSFTFELVKGCFWYICSKKTLTSFMTQLSSLSGKHFVSLEKVALEV